MLCLKSRSPAHVMRVLMDEGFKCPSFKYGLDIPAHYKIGKPPIPSVLLKYRLVNKGKCCICLFKGEDDEKSKRLLP